MEPHRIRLLVSDVDGTLLDSQKKLSRATIDAVRDLGRAGVHFSLVSHRPLQGLKKLMQELDLRCVCAALNGGIIADEQLSVLLERNIRPATVQEVVGTIERYRLDPWIYTREDWYVPRLTGPHVQHEADSLDLSPIVFESLGEMGSLVIKISAVGDNYSDIQACEDQLRSQLDTQLAISRPLANHLDISHVDANKGAAVTAIAGLLKLPLEEVAAAGDGENDIPMFRVAGLSIAMGQAPPEVHRAATDTTTANSQDGLAWAIHHIILDNRHAS